MKNNFVGMGCFYRANPYGLVKTICRGFDAVSGDAMIAYVYVGKGGCASEIFLMLENEFKNIFLNQMPDQLSVVEHRVYTAEVGGSSPSSGTIQ